ncbi:hypothetical protein ACJX0J_015053, partial [Zea mays]
MIAIGYANILKRRIHVLLNIIEVFGLVLYSQYKADLNKNLVEILGRASLALKTANDGGGYRLEENRTLRIIQTSASICSFDQSQMIYIVFSMNVQLLLIYIDIYDMCLPVLLDYNYGINHLTTDNTKCTILYFDQSQMIYIVFSMNVQLLLIYIDIYDMCLPVLLDYNYGINHLIKLTTIFSNTTTIDNIHQKNYFTVIAALHFVFMMIGAQLLYFGMNIDVLSVFQKEYNLKKPSASTITFWSLDSWYVLLCGLLGIPPSNGVLHQSPMHIKSLAVLKRQLLSKKMVDTAKENIGESATSLEIYGKMEEVFIKMDSEEN